MIVIANLKFIFAHKSGVFFTSWLCRYWPEFYGIPWSFIKE